MTISNKLFSESEEVLDQLGSADSSVDQRSVAAQVLGFLRDPSAAPSLIRALEAALKDDAQSVRWTARRALEKLQDLEQ